MDEDKLMACVKGFAWGLIILLLMQMCVGCTSHKQIERIAVEEYDAVKISSATDSVAFAQLIQTIKDIVIESKTNTTTEKILYSKPDEKGEQYVTSIERTQSDETMSAEQHTAQNIIIEYKRLQQVVDSLRSRIDKTEQTKEETKKTSGGVFSWSGKEVAAILALVLLIIIAWICIKTRGFI